MSQLIQSIERQFMKREVPDFRPGDTVRVAVRIIEGDKERIQNFEGVCIGRQGGGMDETFTVRRVSFGVGMERIFPLHSPRIEEIKVLRHGRVRRAKLYYLRDRTGKQARIADTRRKRDEKNVMIQLMQAPMAEEMAPETVSVADVSAQQPAEGSPEVGGQPGGQ